MLIVVSYDIPNDRRRTRLAHTLKDFGERVQYSVSTASASTATGKSRFREPES